MEGLLSKIFVVKVVMQANWIKQWMVITHVFGFMVWIWTKFIQLMAFITMSNDNAIFTIIQFAMCNRGEEDCLLSI